MNTKLPILYYEPGNIIDVPPANIFEDKIFNIEDLKELIKQLNSVELFFFLIEIASKGRLNVDVLIEVLGKFTCVNDFILKSDYLFNNNLIQCIIYFDNVNKYKKLRSINFYFKERVYTEIKGEENQINDEVINIVNNLQLRIVYPLLINSEKRSFSNQLLLMYK